MQKILGKHSDKIYAITRIVLGFFFLCHGAQKLFGVLGGVNGEGATVEIASMMGLAGIIEFAGGLMIAIGFFGSWAAFICSGQMAVGYFMAHAGGGALPIQNGGELAAVYSFVFLYIAARGSGIWSVDAARA